MLYELWELRSAISAANAILMYASELMLEEGGGASNETFQRVSTFLLFETPCCLSRVRYEPEFRSNLRLHMYPSSVNSFFFPPFLLLFFRTYRSNIRIREFHAIPRSYYNCSVNC